MFCQIFALDSGTLFEEQVFLMHSFSINYKASLNLFLNYTTAYVF